jgi:hypothetical protein
MRFFGADSFLAMIGRWRSLPSLSLEPFVKYTQPFSVGRVPTVMDNKIVVEHFNRARLKYCSYIAI